MINYSEFIQNIDLIRAMSPWDNAASLNLIVEPDKMREYCEEKKEFKISDYFGLIAGQFFNLPISNSTSLLNYHAIYQFQRDSRKDVDRGSIRFLYAVDYKFRFEFDKLHHSINSVPSLDESVFIVFVICSDEKSFLTLRHASFSLHKKLEEYGRLDGVIEDWKWMNLSDFKMLISENTTVSNPAFEVFSTDLWKKKIQYSTPNLIHPVESI